MARRGGRTTCALGLVVLGTIGCLSTVVAAGPVGVRAAWEATPLRPGLQRLCVEHGWGLLIDRRVDPGQPVTISIAAETVPDACRAVAESLGLGVSVLGENVYVGPPAAARRLATLAVVRKEQLELKTAAQRTRWLTRKAWKWDELSIPQELVAILAHEGQLSLAPDSHLPHDLWPAVELRPLSLVERLTIVLAGFDLTFEVGAQQQLRFVPQPERVTITQTYPGGKDPAAVVARYQALAPKSQVAVGSKGEVVVNGTVEDHAALARPAKPVARLGPPAGKQVYTLNVVDVPLEKLLATLERELQVKIELRPETLAAVNLTTEARVSLRVASVSADELFRQLLAPLKLEARWAGTTVQIVPQQP